MKIEGADLHIGPRNGPTEIEPVRFVTEANGGKGWKNQPFAFVNSHQQAIKDGCLFTIEPAKDGEQRNAIFVVRSMIDVTFQEAIQKGGGYWLAQSPKGDVVVFEVDQGNQGMMVEWTGKGWVSTWIAKDEEAEVVDITEPTFTPETEEEVPIDDPSVSPEFWRAYHALINRDEKMLEELGINKPSS